MTSPVSSERRPLPSIVGSQHSDVNHHYHSEVVYSALQSTSTLLMFAWFIRVTEARSCPLHTVVMSLGLYHHHPRIHRDASLETKLQGRYMIYALTSQR